MYALLLLSLAPAQLRPTAPDADPSAVLARLEATTREVNASLAQIRRDNEDVLTSLRQMNAQVAALRGDVSSLTTQLTALDYRVTALERGTVRPYRAPATLTDPLAAAAAGRVAGQYDGFGRLVPPGQAVPVSRQFAFHNPTRAMMLSDTGPETPDPYPAMRPPVQLMQLAPFAPAYGVGCGAGSCGAGGCRRAPVRNFLFGRR